MSQAASSIQTEIISSNFDGVTVVKLPVKKYKELAGHKKCYAPEAVKQVMEQIGIPTNNEINFFLQNGYIYLFPRSEKGLDHDFIILTEALHKL